MCVKYFLLITALALSCSYGFNESNIDFVEFKNLLESKVEEIQTMCDKRYKELEQKLEAKEPKRSISGGIAFSTLLTNMQSHIGLGTTIQFDQILLNDGSGYDARTGIFTAPESGVYMFSYFLGHGNQPGQAWLQLMHNGHKINGAVTDTLHVNEDLQGGNIGIFRVNAGERVWLETFHQNDAYIDGRYGFTSFSGVYLFV